MTKIKFLKTIQTFDLSGQMVYFQQNKIYEITPDHFLYKRIYDLISVVGWVEIKK